MISPLETARLVLRPLQLADASQVQVVFPHWEIVRYLNHHVPWPYPSDGAFKYFRNVLLPEIANGTTWSWTLRLKSDTERIIGGISLKQNETDNRGFWIGLPWQRMGLMTEASAVVSSFWFETLGFEVLRVSKAISNDASRKISVNQGMRVIATEDREYVSGRLPAEIWELTAEEWQVHRRPKDQSSL